MTTQDHVAIARQIEELNGLTVNELREKWVEVWNEPCRSRNKDYLRKRIAWKIQANAYGGLSERALQRAAELADESYLNTRMDRMPPPQAGGRSVHGHIHAPGDPRLPAPGTVITRDYKGRKLLVAVLEKGFEFEGRIYRSLSAIAKEVTGAHWNGVHFFGLNKKEAA
jgi:hypothetical protein